MLRYMHIAQGRSGKASEMEGGREREREKGHTTRKRKHQRLRQYLAMPANVHCTLILVDIDRQILHDKNKMINTHTYLLIQVQDGFLNPPIVLTVCLANSNSLAPCTTRTARTRYKDMTAFKSTVGLNI